MNTKTALVTGANRGLGLATARALAEGGYHVIMLGRSPDKIERASRELKGRGLDVESVAVDVTDADQIRRLAKSLGERFGHLDILVNNAGAAFENPDRSKPQETSIFKVSQDVVLRTFHVNTLGPLHMVQALLPLLRQAPAARIVNVSSGMGQLTEMEGLYPAYRISKTALNAITRILAAELADTPIKVNSVCPGWVKTDMGGPDATRSIDEGIKGIVWAATLGAEGPSGGFFRDGKPIPW